MGRSLKIGSLSNGFITLAGGNMSFCRTKIHLLLTVIVGYFQGPYKEQMHNIFLFREQTF